MCSAHNRSTRTGETHSDHGENDTDRTTSSFGQSDAQDLLCEIQDINGHVQQGEGIILTLHLLGFWGHGQKSRLVEVVGGTKVARKHPTLVEMGGHSVVACLV